MQADADKDFAKRMDEARESGKICLIQHGAASREFGVQTSYLANIMAGGMQCQYGNCQEAATYVCGATELPEFVCDEHAGAHARCIDCYNIDDLRVTLRTATLANVTPEPELVRNALFARDGKRYRLVAMATEDMDRANWSFTMQVFGSPTAPSFVTNLHDLETLFFPDSAPALTARFFAISKSWVIVEKSEDVPLRGLNRLVAKNALTEKEANAVRKELKTGSMDGVIELLRLKEFCWLPQLDTPNPATRAKDHTGLRDDDDEEHGAAELAASDAQAALESALPPRRIKRNFWPVCMGATVLGPMRWANPHHGGSRIPIWSEGPGIGIGQMFVGLSRRPSVFGFHAEAASTDFVNVSSIESDNVRWKFIPINFENNVRLFRLVSDVAQDIAESCFKGLLLTDATLQHYGITGATEIVQRPGSAIASHNYHFGIGMQKIAEAHQWHSKPWFMLKTATHADFPATPSQKHGVTDFSEDNAAVHGPDPADEEDDDDDVPPPKKRRVTTARRTCKSDDADAAAAE